MAVAADKGAVGEGCSGFTRASKNTTETPTPTTAHCNARRRRSTASSFLRPLQINCSRLFKSHNINGRYLPLRSWKAQRRTHRHPPFETRPPPRTNSSPSLPLRSRMQLLTRPQTLCLSSLPHQLQHRRLPLCATHSSARPPQRRRYTPKRRVHTCFQSDSPPFRHDLPQQPLLRSPRTQLSVRPASRKGASTTWVTSATNGRPSAT